MKLDPSSNNDSKMNESKEEEELEFETTPGLLPTITRPSTWFATKTYATTKL